MVKPVIPETTFNQPLLGGKFGRDSLLPVPDAEDTEIKINFINYKTSELDDVQYYLFLNEYHDMMMELYKDVYLCEDLIRRTNEQGDEELVTRERQEEEQNALWEQHLSKFQKQLIITIDKAIVPRINDSVGEMLVASIDNKVVKKDVLESMVEYAANNGEITSSGDLEIADAKFNDPRLEKYIFDFVSTAFKNPQIDKFNNLYKKYIFVSRWRCFEQLSLNRILPMEDFDEKVRSKLNWDEENKQKNKQKNKLKKNSEVAEAEEGKNYYPYPSTLLLWALSPDDTSTEWFRILESDSFSKAYEDKEKYKEILNQND